MSKGTVNKVILVGNLGRDPEIKHANTGMVIANLALATTGSWKDKTTGENKESTEWHRVVLYGKLAELADSYMKKGSKVYIEGRLQTKKWEKEGQTHYTTEIVGESLQMLSGKTAEVTDEKKDEKLTTMTQRNRDLPVPEAGLDDDIPF